MADILAFVRNTQRSTRTASASDDSSNIVLFPGASVGMLKALLERPEDELVAAAMDGRTDN